MAYRVDEQTNEIVIDGFEQGIAPSPYKGIANIRNLNVSYYPGVAYPTYRRQAATLTETGNTIWIAGAHSTNVSNNEGWFFSASSPVSMANPVGKTVSPSGLIYILDSAGSVWKQTAVNSSAFNLLGNDGRFTNGAAGIAYFNNYLAVFGNGVIEFCGDGTGDSTIISGNWNINNAASGSGQASTTFTTTFAGNANNLIPTTALSRLPKFQTNDPIVFSTTGTLPLPIATGTTYYILAIATDTSTMTISTSVGGAAVILTSDGTGTHTVADIAEVTPFGNCTNLQTTTSSNNVKGITTATIASYVNPLGVTVTSNWLQPSGTYQITTADNTKIAASFTYGSTTVTFLNPIVYLSHAGSPTWTVQLLDPTVTDYRPYVSKNDGNLYFANGTQVGSINRNLNTNTNFNPTLKLTYTVSYSTVLVVILNEVITDITDLNSVMVISGQKDMYTWDYLSATTKSPIPIGEKITRIVNLLNNIYVLAGQKGNIYIFNGYSAQLFTKVSDYISGAIDPVWSWGDFMIHRARLFFSALVQDTSGNNLLAGIFSLIASPSVLGESASGIVMESQNSYGLTPSAGATAQSLLIDNSPSSSGQNSYYSAWSNGASTGGIDYNDTTFWQNNEPVIETDIIPLGSVLEKRTLGQIMFKLDRPMTTGDSITLYSRNSLSDTYALLGTTTTGVLSDYQKTNIWEQQWAQFKVTFSCAASGSSRIPLREIRIQTQ